MKRLKILSKSLTIFLIITHLISCNTASKHINTGNDCLDCKKKYNVLHERHKKAITLLKKHTKNNQINEDVVNDINKEYKRVRKNKIREIITWTFVGIAIGTAVGLGIGFGVSAKFN